MSKSHNVYVHFDKKNRVIGRSTDKSLGGRAERVYRGHSEKDAEDMKDYLNKSRH